VTVWDLDALRAATLAELGEQVGPVERAALAMLDWELISKSLGMAARDIAIRGALSLVLAPVRLGPAAEALLGVVDGVYDFLSWRDKVLLADIELLTESRDTRRILSADPSLVPLFLDVVGILGDAAAIAKLPRIVRALGRVQLVGLAAISVELVPALARLGIALVQREEARERARAESGR
jgi:hypothetical protein